MRSLCAIVALLAFVGLNNAAKFPSNFQLCVRNDPNLDACLTSAIDKAMKNMVNGVPSLRVLPIDPLAVTQIIVQDSPGRPVNININMTDAALKGFRNIKVKKVVADLDKHYAEIDVFVPLFEVDGNYVMNGKFLVLPLRGEGRGNFKLHDAQIKLTIRWDILKKDGDLYWNVNDFHADIYKTSKLETKLSNLFNGDESLAKPTLEALNTSWEAFWGELRPSIEETFSYIFKNIVRDILRKVPEKDMFLPANQ